MIVYNRFCGTTRLCDSGTWRLRFEDTLPDRVEFIKVDLTNKAYDELKNQLSCSQVGPREHWQFCPHCGKELR